MPKDPFLVLWLEGCAHYPRVEGTLDINERSIHHCKQFRVEGTLPEVYAARIRCRKGKISSPSPRALPPC
ncbi:unnamed protein product [Victoria cruziana]